MPYIKPASLGNLKYYEYRGKDLSYTSKYIMQPFWTWVAGWVPLTTAPNFVTFVGFLFSSTLPVLIAYYAYVNDAFVGDKVFPGWMWLVCACCLFAYQTLDACDGKHARRTKTSSPLGELFDHGCDALFTPLLQFAICTCLSLTGWQRHLHFFFVCNTLFASIWEQYTTGTLDLWYINGPVEGLLLTVAAFLWSAMVPQSWWQQPLGTLPAFGPISRFRGVSFSTADVLFSFTAGMAALTMLMNVASVVRNRYFGSPESQLPWVQPARAIFIQSFVNVAYVGSFLFVPEVFAIAPYCFEVSFGILCAITATRLTLCRLCRTPYVPFSRYHFVFLCSLAAAVGVWRASGQVQKVRVIGLACVATGVIAYLHMAISVFQQIATHLGIHVITLTGEQKRRILADASAATKKQ